MIDLDLSYASKQMGRHIDHKFCLCFSSGNNSISPTKLNFWTSYVSIFYRFFFFFFVLLIISLLPLPRSVLHAWPNYRYIKLNLSNILLLLGSPLVLKPNLTIDNIYWPEATAATWHLRNYQHLDRGPQFYPPT